MSYLIILLEGKYCVGDGKLKPDCVEVVVREVLDLLLYGKS